MRQYAWKIQLEKICSSCKWYPIITNLSIGRANRILQRAFYSSITILGIDLKRGSNGEYLIKADGEYIELEVEDFELCIYQLAHQVGLDNYIIDKDVVRFVLDRTYRRKQVLV